jgi:hypothetical protein
VELWEFVGGAGACVCPGKFNAAGACASDFHRWFSWRARAPCRPSNVALAARGAGTTGRRLRASRPLWPKAEGPAFNCHHAADGRAGDNLRHSVSTVQTEGKM